MGPPSGRLEPGCPVVGRSQMLSNTPVAGFLQTLSNLLPVTTMRIAMYAICIVRYRKPLEEVVKFQEAHRAFQRRLLNEGVLLAAGPHEPRFGGMFLVRVPDDNPQ